MTINQIRTRPTQADTPYMTDLERALIRSLVPILRDDDIADCKRQKLAKFLQVSQAERRKRQEESERESKTMTYRAMVMSFFLVLAFGLVQLVSLAGQFRLDFPESLLLSAAWAVGAWYVHSHPWGADRTLGVDPNLGWRRYVVGWSRPVSPEQYVVFIPFHFFANGRYVLHCDYSAPGVAQVTRIPEQIQTRCWLLHEAGAECAFVMDQLDTDPFLYAVDRVGNQFCLGAWDEDYVG